MDEKTKKIVESEAFRAINLLVDQKIDELDRLLLFLKDRMLFLAENKDKYPLQVTKRVSYEGRDGRTPETHTLSMNVQELKRIAETIDDTLKLQSQIADLQAFKLRLLNDYDYTRDDDSEQKEVFGDL